MLRLSVSEVQRFQEELHCPGPGLSVSHLMVPVRQLMAALGLDERRLLKLHLEHKLLQALVLYRYCGEAVPPTCGLDRFLTQREIGDPRELLPEIMEQNILLKSTRGYGSEPTLEYDKNYGVINKAIERCLEGKPVSHPEQEQFIIQERLAIDAEYRVHTLEDQVVPDLTHRRFAPTTSIEERIEANAFVQTMLDRMPQAMVADAVCGWDVARTTAGDWRIIEINYTGFHTIFGRGFQCSGYFTEPQWGFARVARLLRHAERMYAVRISIEETADPADPEFTQLYAWIASGLELLRGYDDFARLISKVEQIPIPEVIGGASHPPQSIQFFKSYTARLKGFLAVLQ